MLQGRIAIVTGPIRGIGLGTAEAFARFFRHVRRFFRQLTSSLCKSLTIGNFRDRRLERATSAPHMQVTSMCRVLSMLLVASTASVLLVPSAWAAEPSKLIETMTTEIVEIVKTKTDADRKAAIRRVVQERFDLSYMGRLALGMHWTQATEQQRARFLAAVEASLAHAYSERLGKYAGYTLTIGNVISRPNCVWVVDSRLNHTSGRPIRIEWEVHESGQGLRVVDVKVEGISLSTIMRSDFGSYIQSKFGEVESLVKELEARAIR